MRRPKLDYNKMLKIISLILIACFFIFIIEDYTRYNDIYNSAPFYVFIIVRMVEFILPGAVLLYLYNQNTHVKESFYTVKSSKLTNAFNGYKIAHISDLHNTNSKRIKKVLVKKLEENVPDVIFITGDLIDSRRTNIETAKEFIKSIAHIAPIYYVLGNHESRLENITELQNLIQQEGTIVLRNEKIKLYKSGEHIELFGLDDPDFYNCKQENCDIKSKLEEKIYSLDSNKDTFTVLLIHRPEYLETYSKYNLDLVFTGHAHGGQIRIPFVGGIIAPGQGFLPKYTNGMHQINGTTTVISRGIGNSKFPFRINNRPELVFIELKREKIK